MKTPFGLVLIGLIGLFVGGCQHTPPTANVNVDRSSWVQVARFLSPGSATKMTRVLEREGIPVSLDGAAYPAYPIKVPPEQLGRASALITQRGYEMFVTR
jgi:hypothetical protein